MHKLRSFRTVLILMLILANFLIYGNAAAQCPNDPCPKQTQSGEIVDNPDMALQWENGYPPAEIERNKTAELKLKSGKRPFTWTISGLEETDIVIRTSEMSIEISPTCTAEENITVVVTDGKTDLNETINLVALPVKFDFGKTGTGAVAANSQKNVYVKGGCGGPYTWTVEEVGFYFDDGRLDNSVTTDANKATLYM